jgi:hypothetical protein
MKKTINLEWFLAAGVRALKTFAQALASSITVGGALGDFNWTYILSVAAVAAIYSFVTSLSGLPEVGTDGTLIIDTSDPEKDTYRFAFDAPLEELATKKKVIFCVDTSTKSA